ncbi:MAG: hypothetical protein AB7I50_04340 [Vicinamibacterales bacterium]
MRLSIRSRLTFWYTAVVVAILLTGGILGSLAQARLALQDLDADLERTMATLVGVMHTEFGEGLTLEAHADEASREVVAPGHGLALVRAVVAVSLDASGRLARTADARVGRGHHRAGHVVAAAPAGRRVSRRLHG